MKNLENFGEAKGYSSLRAASQCGPLTSTRAHGSGPSLRASEGCVAIQPRMLNVFTGLLRWHRRSLKPHAEVLCIGAAQPPRNDAGGQAGFIKGCMALGHENSARSALNELTSNYFRLTTKTAFTMAEILLSLTIIGVVAAITLPSLTGNINERTWNTQRKALYSRISQAIALMPALNGYGSGDTSTETFITAGLSKVLKINNVCDNTHLADCGVPAKFTNLSGQLKDMPTTLYGLSGWFSLITYSEASYSTTNTNATAFETQNGESIVAYYNKNCVTTYRNQEYKTSFGNTFGFPQKTTCLNFIYDLNGKKGPNTVGKDIGFITVYNATDSTVVAPNPANKDASEEALLHAQGISACKGQDNDYRMPNIDELNSMVTNKLLMGTMKEDNYWSSSVLDSNYGWSASFQYGEQATGNKASHQRFVRCVKR